MASLSTQTSSSVPVITSPSQPDEPLRSAHIATNIGGLSTRLRFCKTSDGAHLAYVVIGPTDHQASSGNANKRKSKMRSTRSVTTPVVMLPALGMLKEDWGEFAFELSKNRQVLLLDYRGLGDSLMPNQPLPLGEDGAFIASSSIFNFNPSKQVDDYYESTRTTKLPRLANDVLEIIRDCFWSREAYGGKAWKRFNLLGHGMGGAVAQTMSLVLMPSSPMADPQYTSEFDPNDPRKEGMGIEHLVLLGASARAVNQGYGGGVFEALSKDDIGEAGALMATAPEDKKILSEIWRTGRRPRIMIEKQFLSLTSFDYIDDNPLLSLFSLPTFVAHGYNDSQVPYLEGFLIHKRIRGSFWKRVEGAGHWLHVGKYADEVLQYVSAFLRDDWDGKAKL